MKRIMLVCSAGMSTSLLVTKMQTAAKEMGQEIEIFAVAEADSKNQKPVDLVLLGPQVRFLMAQMQKNFAVSGTPVAIIDSMLYGTMNGKAVLETAMTLMKA